MFNWHSTARPRVQTWTTPSGPAQDLFLDMLEQPHLLIAGATGSGKSVLINGLVYTALYSFPGSEEGSRQFILLDPKRVELVDFQGLPHTLRYASEPAEIIMALQDAIRITENRYREMQKIRVKRFPGGDIYVIIDELADLMTTNRKQVQPLIQRLCQIGRAARVHVIAATQCPLVKIIPTEIKVNFDAIVGLHTATARHSRNIIGVSGCEDLPRYGKGYYFTPSEESLYNIPYIKENDILERVAWWTAQTA